SDLQLNTNLAWISDTSSLGPDLSQTLQGVYRNRLTAPAQFYVSLTPELGDTSFDHELSYASLRLPDSGYQVLALFRFWNMVQYYYPDRNVMADDPVNQPDYWNQVLAQSIPAVAQAANSLAYQQALIRFIAKINDTHANLWSSLSARPPIGSCYLP